MERKWNRQGESYPYTWQLKGEWLASDVKAVLVKFSHSRYINNCYQHHRYIVQITDCEGNITLSKKHYTLPYAKKFAQTHGGRIRQTKNEVGKERG
jgi:hypothetical protein